MLSRTSFRPGSPALAILALLLLLPSLLFARPRLQSLDDSRPLRIYPIKPGLDFLYQPSPPEHWYRFPLTDFQRLSAHHFHTGNLPAAGALVISTAFLVNRDKAILKDAQRLGDQWHLPHTNQQARLVDWRFRFAGCTIDASPHVPHDLESGMYFLGDGLLHSALGAGLWSYGTLRGDERAATTGAQVLEVMACTCIATQVIKHVCGRESPLAATRPGGKWQLLPDPVEYARHPPRFDAMPSGHVATAMGTVTVLADNYPEQVWIRPVGYSLIGVLMYAMVNNGVHWASDYPLGLAAGYAIAKVVDARSRTLITPAEGPDLGLVAATRLMPYADRQGAGLCWRVEFR